MTNHKPQTTNHKLKASLLASAIASILFSAYVQAAPSGITIPAGYTPVSSEAEFDEIYQGIRTKSSEKIFLHINEWKPTKTYYLEGNLSILGSGTTTIDGSHFNKFGYFIGNTIYDWGNHLKDENGNSILKYSNHFSLSNMDIINFGNETISIVDLSSVQDAQLDNVRFIRNSIHSDLGAVTIDGEDCNYHCQATINNSFFSRNRISFLKKVKICHLEYWLSLEVSKEILVYR